MWQDFFLNEKEINPQNIVSMFQNILFNPLNHNIAPPLKSLNSVVLMHTVSWVKLQLVVRYVSGIAGDSWISVEACVI